MIENYHVRYLSSDFDLLLTVHLAWAPGRHIMCIPVLQMNYSTILSILSASDEHTSTGIIIDAGEPQSHRNLALDYTILGA